jgi:hypothetical protein
MRPLQAIPTASRSSYLRSRSFAELDMREMFKPGRLWG